MKKSKKIINKIWFLPHAILSKSRSVSILELFFDVIVVVALGGVVEKIGYDLQQKVWVNSLIFSISLLLFVLIIWRGFSLYSSRYENQSIRHKLLTLTLVLLLSFFTVGIWSTALSTKIASNFFILALMILGTVGTLLIMTYILFSASLGKENQYEKKSLRRQSYGFFLILLLLLISYITSQFITTNWGLPLTNTLFLLGIIMHFLFEYLSQTNKLSINIPKHYREHVQERYSILFIIFLGEMLMQIVRTTAENLGSKNPNIKLDDHYIVILKFMGALIILYSWWWSFKEIYYFSDIINNARRIQMFGLLMIFIYIGTTFSLVGITFWLKNDANFQTGNLVFFIGSLLSSIFTSIISCAISRIKQSEKFIWPKWFKIKLWVQPLLVASISMVIFMPLGWKFVYFLIVVVIAIAEIFWWIYIKVYQLRHVDKMQDQYKKEWHQLRLKLAKYINYQYKNYVDLNLHQQHNWKLNEYSQYFKKLYFKKIKTSSLASLLP